MKYIYLAGPLTPQGRHNTNLAIEYLRNVKVMIEAALKVLHAGLVPFCPALDFLFFLLSDKPITEKEIKNFSLAWLKKCDTLVLLPGWKESPGANAELDYALAQGLKVFYSVEECIKEAKNGEN